MDEIPVFNRQYLYNAGEEIDAAMFSGDAFFAEQNRIALRWLMARWEKELATYDTSDQTEGGTK